MTQNLPEKAEWFKSTGTPSYSEFIHLSRYSRWVDSENRREDWEETVSRYIKFWVERFPQHEKEIEKVKPWILRFDTMPSMRALMAAGKALNKVEMAAYNCSYIVIDNQRAFDELMYILMCGTGVGFSVERQYVAKLPEVSEDFHESETVIRVRDSRIGWASSFRELISLLYNGQIPQWDTSKVRKAGERLKTFGGRASGPEPLEELFRFAVNLFRQAAGRKLSSIECHDLACKVAEIVIVGGVRRCYPGDARVLTPSGTKSMTDIKVGDEVISLGMKGTVTAKVASGKQSLLKIKHRFGSTRLTPSHRIAVVCASSAAYKFKEASDVRIGDRVVLDTASGPNSSTFMPSPVISVEKDGEEQTWDIETSLREFTADGLVTHNSALLSLSNLSDDRMRRAKMGQWVTTDPQRRLANNSAAYTEKPDLSVFMEEWLSLYNSKAGERGIFNREAAVKKAAKNGRRDTNYEFGCNPCAEILIRPNGLCNLSEVVLRNQDTIEDIEQKIVVATILGTLQATLTNFKYVRKVWRRNAEEEALLGVSLTGIMDHPILGDASNDDLPGILEKLRQVSIDTNKVWAEKLGINQAAAIGTVKPSGCRPAEALTPTSKGLLTLDEICNQHVTKQQVASQWSDLNDISVYQDNGLASASKTYVNGESPLVEITMSYNMQVESTPNHKWFVKQRYEKAKLHKYVDVGEWVRADEIQPNDILEISTCSYKGEQEAQLVSVTQPEMARHATVEIELAQPDHMSPQLAWLLGYFYGDGCLSPQKSRVRFTDQHIVNLEKVQLILKDTFNVDSVTHRASEARDAWVLENGSVWLYDWFVANGFDKSTMEVPLKIRESSRESIIAFMAGMIDSDGEVTATKSAKYIITTAYDSFAKQLQEVGWAVGMGVGRSLNTQGSNFQAQKHMWHLTSCEIDGEGAASILAKHCNKAAKVVSWHHETTNRSSILGKVLDTRVSRTAPTFDIEVPDSHWYYSGSVKSHNTVSQLVNSASGIHARFSEYYIRRVRVDQSNPLTEFMISSGFEHEVDLYNPKVVVFSFPIKSPEGATLVKDVGAMEQLKIWKIYQDHWCEHKPSCTVYYTDDEFLEVGAWIWENFDEVSGLSFLPKNDHIYKQAPYEEITKEEYEEQVAKMPDVAWEELQNFEEEDTTTGTQELACTGGVCELVDVVAD